MALQKTKSTEVEAEREALARELTAEEGEAWAEKYRPGSFGCHELLDRTSREMDSVDRYIRSHPACVADPEWFALADQAFSALFELYQKVGSAHLVVESTLSAS